MKHLITIFLLCLTLTSVEAQDVPNLIPPSPEAASIVGYGNTGVNFYTGSPSLSIPIYTATSRGVSIPVSLSYSGFGGIKVEEVAPWVGLGWSLNAGGVVSRSIRGLRDDFGNGYTNLSDISDLDNTTITEYQDYADGDNDSEPDEFNFNVNGMSGTFFLDRAGEAVQKTKSDIKIDPVFASLAIDYFKVTGTDGTVYIFDAEEGTKSFAIGENPSAVQYQTTSWYLTNILDQAGDTLMKFTYHEFNEPNPLKHITYYAQNELELGVVFTDAYMKKSWNYTEARRIKEIEFDQGKIKFNQSTTARQDYLNDYRLDNIEIVDNSDNLIKKFTLDYSYFTTTGTALITSTPTGILFQNINAGDYERRLRLDAVQEWDDTGLVSNPAHEFTYNSTHYLPSRYSFNQDHWGYYNGASNTTPEAAHKIKYYGVAQTSSLVGFGSADREPSEAHAQAGILTKVTYPTGGHTSFTFGQHQAVEARLKNNYSQQTLNFEPDGNWSSTDPQIILINDPFETVTINADASHTCSIAVAFYETDGTTYVTGADMDYISGPSIHSHGTKTVALEPGTYKVKATISGGCSWQVTDNIELVWDNETLKTNKDVGGIRVEAIEDHDGIDVSNDVRREFYYNEDGDTGSSNSTGRVVNVPQYGVQMVQNTSTLPPTITMVPNGYMRTIKSNYPLMKTNGSEVGYGKVTVRTIGGQNNGKTEYFFTTAEDYADFYDGYYYSALNGESYFALAGVGTVDTYPFPRVDSRDYLRGLLTKQIDYRWTGSAYHKVKEVENTYVGTYNAPTSNLEPFDTNVYFPTTSVASNGLSYEAVEGIVHKPGVHNHFKRYEIYAGKVDMQKSVTKTYNLGSNTVFSETETTNFWDDLADDHYQISRTQTKDSEGTVYETKMFYPYDASGLTGLVQADYTAMVNKNIISTPIQQEQFKGTTKLSTTRTIFDGFGNYYLPAEVQTAKSTNSLEARVRYHSYDSKGNPRELSQENGTRIVYLWGYDQTFPVAQIQNATYADVSAVINQTILDNPASDAALRTELDKLRTATSLKGALVTTMTYDPAIGMTSQTTPNGLTTTYEYDSFNRLKYVKDKDGNILRKMEYTYKVNANTTNN